MLLQRCHSCLHGTCDMTFIYNYLLLSKRHTIHYDTDLQTHWWRTIDFFIRVVQAEIVLNADKFYCARRMVDFAGFHISFETLEPLPKYMDAICDFPSPTSTTDIRNWFGLVNQIANYALLRDIMYTQYSDSVNFQVLTITQRDQH